MKKILILLAFLLNLMPFFDFEEKTISISGNEAIAQSMGDEAMCNVLCPTTIVTLPCELVTTVNCDPVIVTPDPDPYYPPDPYQPPPTYNPCDVNPCDCGLCGPPPGSGGGTGGGSGGGSDDGSSGGTPPEDNSDCPSGGRCGQDETGYNDNKCCTCPEGWEEIYNFVISTEAGQAIGQKNVQDQGGWYPQIKDSGVGDINMDNYELNINNLPINPATGQRYTPQGFFNYVRMNLFNFIHGGPATLEPYSAADETKWRSYNPVGAALSFQSTFDDMTVVCTEYVLNSTDMTWTFTTMRSPNDLGHPVSGHRQFGFKTNADGSYTFYTKGVDRLATWADYSVNEAGGDFVFNQGDQLWKAMIENLQDDIEEKEGSVEDFDSEQEYGERYEYDESGNCD